MRKQIFMGFEWDTNQDLSSKLGHHRNYVADSLCKKIYKDVYHLIAHHVNKNLIKKSFPYRGIHGKTYREVCGSIDLTVEEVDNWCVLKESDIVALIDEILDNGMTSVLAVIYDKTSTDSSEKTSTDSSEYVYIKRSYLLMLRDLIDDILSSDH